MTSPAPVGFPDWQRTFAAARNLLANVTSHQANPQDIYGPFPTVNLHSIGINLRVQSSGGIQLFIGWYQDAAATVQLTSEIISVVNGDRFDQSITVKGPFAKVFATAQPAAPVTYSLTVYEATSDFVTQSADTDNILLGLFNQSIGASSAQAFGASRVWAGPAAWFCQLAAGVSWHAELIATHADGTTLTIMHVDNAVPLQTQMLYLPAAPLTMNLTNNDASARTLNAFLTAKPLYP